MSKHLETRKTRISRRQPTIVHTENDCVVVIYTSQPALLGKRFPLTEGDQLHVGREPDSDILLQDDSVSRKHAHFERRLDGWYVVDGNSTNGTHVNEEQVPSACLLANNDRIQTGSTIFKYLSGADADVRYYEEIYRVSILDGLTQIYNKRYFTEMLEREVIRARRHSRPVSLILLDVDHFKQCNDEHGHLAGDAVLRDLAKLLSARVRREEVFARYGGEEFVLLLPETSLANAKKLADTFRHMIERHAFEVLGENIRITASAGCAEFQADDDTALDMVERADRKLYEAKDGGRNRVEA